MLDLATCYRRHAEIPELVRHVAIRNPLVKQLIRAYVTGSIVTLEECLAQMVVALADHSAEMDSRVAILVDHFSR